MAGPNYGGDSRPPATTAKPAESARRLATAIDELAKASAAIEVCAAAVLNPEKPCQPESVAMTLEACRERVDHVWQIVERLLANLPAEGGVA